jgi:diphosphomevalonate decarboxylase
MEATARAHSNIALVKYWGKRASHLNLPAVGSISVTLEELHTTTSVKFNQDLTTDVLILNGRKTFGKELERTSEFLDIVRERAGFNLNAEIISENNFPTAAGLASSASGFAALALAGSGAAGLPLSGRELSVLARIGSGSAARSIFGGFVEMHRGLTSDGSDAYAEQLENERYWDLRILIGVTSQIKKKIGSTDGMNLSKGTSPYYSSWIENSENDLSIMREAIRKKDFQQLGDLSEFSCLKMHALALASNPGMLYWNGTTVEGMNLIRDLRKSGISVYFTIDAGPQLKAICLPDAVDKVKGALEQLPGIQKVICTKLGGDAQLLERN